MDDTVGLEHRRNLLSYNLAALMVIMKAAADDHVGLIVDVDDSVGREMMEALVGRERVEEHRASMVEDSPTVLTHLPERIVRRWLRDNHYTKTLAEWQRGDGMQTILIIGAGGITLAQRRRHKQTAGPGTC